MPTVRHELFEELDAFNPKWQVKYKSLGEAALAANAIGLYNDFVRTAEGQAYLARMHGVRDAQAEADKVRNAQDSASLAGLRTPLATLARLERRKPKAEDTDKPISRFE